MGDRVSTRRRRTSLTCCLISAIAMGWSLPALAFNPETDHVCRANCGGGNSGSGGTRRESSGDSAAIERWNRSSDLSNEATQLGNQHRWGEAIAKYQQAIATDPTNFYAKGLFNGMLGRIAQEQCYNLFNQHSYRAALAKCQEARGDYERAAQFWSDEGWATTNYPSLMEFLPRLAGAARKEDLDATGKLVSSLLDQGRAAEAWQAASDLMRRNPGMLAASDPMQDYASWMFQHQRNADSESAYRIVLSWKEAHGAPADEVAPLHGRIALTRRNGGDLAGALAELGIAAREDPSAAVVHTFIADIYMRQGRAADARDEIARARALGDQSWLAGDVEKRLAAGSARSQLPTVNLNSVQAKQSPGAAAAKQKASCGFDTMGPGCSIAPASEAVPAFRKTDSDPPAVAALKFMIPTAAWAKHDPQINQSVAWFAKLESEKAEKQDQLRALEQTIGQGGGDKAVLAAQKKTLEDGLARIDGYQARAKATIAKALKHYDLTWSEEQPVGAAAPASAGKSARPAKQDQLTPEQRKAIDNL
jgi:hypothetical protein